MTGSSGRYVYFFRLSTEALKTRNRLTIPEMQSADPSTVTWDSMFDG